MFDKIRYCSWCFQASWQSDQVCRFCSLPHKHCTNTSKENSDNLNNRNYYHLDSRLLALQIWLARHMSSLLWLYEGILGQYHLMSGYGVFPVKLQSKLSENRLSFSIKAQHPETLRWHSYKPRYYPSSISAALLWFAPHQPRIVSFFLLTLVFLYLIICFSFKIFTLSQLIEIKTLSILIGSCFILRRNGREIRPSAKTLVIYQSPRSTW